MEEILRAILPLTSSMVKFIFGPIVGFEQKLHPLTTIIATVAGTMISVISFTYFGKYLRERLFRKYFESRKKPELADELAEKKTMSKFARFAMRYGLAGIAFFTPLILTPIGGTLLAVGIGSPKEKIILYMLISAVCWAVILTGIIYFVGHQALPTWIK